MFAPFKKLLPNGTAWLVPAGGSVSKVLAGLSPAMERAKTFADSGYLDALPAHTRELGEWEEELGIFPRQGMSDEARRAQITRLRATTGGQSPAYIQSQLQAFGFDVYLHECWASRDPFVARDPRSYTTQPLIGTHRCGAPGSRCGAPGARCNRFLVNWPGYWQTLMWKGEAPDRVPDDPDFWPFFIYLGGETFGTTFDVLASRWREFQYQVQRLKPCQNWVVVFANIIDDTEGGVFDHTFVPAFE